MIDGEEEMCLTPKDRYSKIPNIYFVPTVSALKNWCHRAINTVIKDKSRENLSFCLLFVKEWDRMRILTVGFDDEYVKELEKELDKYFICIVDNAKDLYDATNFTDFRHYELVIIVDEGVKFSLERYVNEVKKKKSETKIMILTSFQKMRLLMHFGKSRSMFLIILLRLRSIKFVNV